MASSIAFLVIYTLGWAAFKLAGRPVLLLASLVLLSISGKYMIQQCPRSRASGGLMRRLAALPGTVPGTTVLVQGYRVHFISGGRFFIWYLAGFRARCTNLLARARYDYCTLGETLRGKLLTATIDINSIINIRTLHNSRGKSGYRVD